MTTSVSEQQRGRIINNENIISLVKEDNMVLQTEDTG